MRILFLALFLLQAIPAVAQSTAPSDESLRQLFAATHITKIMDAYLTQVDAGMQAGLRAALGDKPPSARQQQIIDDMRTRIMGVFRESLSWEKIEPMMMDIYRRNFTQREVADMLKFYGSPSGRSVVDKIPLTMQAASKEIQGMLPPVIEKLQQIQKDTVAQLKDAADAAAPQPPK